MGSWHYCTDYSGSRIGEVAGRRTASRNLRTCMLGDWARVSAFLAREPGSALCLLRDRVCTDVYELGAARALGPRSGPQTIHLRLASRRFSAHHRRHHRQEPRVAIIVTHILDPSIGNTGCSGPPANCSTRVTPEARGHGRTRPHVLLARNPLPAHIATVDFSPLF